MRITSVVATWGYAPGGLERHVRSLDEVFQSLDHEHRVVAAWCRSSWAGRVDACSPSDPPRAWRDQLLQAKRLLRDSERLGSGSTDVMLLHSVAPLLATRGSRLRRIALNYHPPGLERRANWDETRRRGPQERIAEEMLDLLERRSMRRCSAVVVLSDHSKRLLERSPSPVRAEVISPHLQPRRRLSHGPEGPIVVIRRLAPRMGHREMLDEIAPVLRERGKRLVIASDGPMRPSLENQTRRLGLQELVSFVGSLSDGQLADLYGEACLALVPARGGEGFGLAASEALAAGVIPLVSDVPTLAELVSPIDGMLVVPHGCWSESLERVLDLHPAQRARLLRAAARRADEFALGRIAAHWNEVLTACA